MNRISIYVVFLLIISLLACSKKGDQSFSAGNDFYEAFKKAIEKSIKDEDKQKQAIAVVDNYVDELTNFDQYLDQYEKKNLDVILDYHSTEQDLMNATEDLNVERDIFYKKMLDLHTQMVELTTEEEWEALTKKLKTNLFNY